MKTRYFTLAIFNCVIKLVLKKSRFEDRQKQFEQYIENNYSVYLVKNKERAHFTITIEDGGENIVLLHKKNEYFSRIITEGKNSLTSYYYADETVINILLRYIISRVLEKKGVILHASSIIYDNTVVLFCGTSGIGKSTLAQGLGKKYKVFTDDLICLIKDHKSNNTYSAHQIPLPEKNNIDKTLNKYPIGKIFFLRRSKTPTIKKINNVVKTYNLLIEQLWTEKKYIRYNLKTLEKIRDMNIQYNVFGLGTPPKNPHFFIQYMIGGNS